ncbi:alpha/beta fold hydrolase [Microcella daejeonensis]|uniref:alpha/beta fold hydrolase n=1 Tax=Microcella daejeonensis TaxID=2994971 RepID=UPI002271E2E6|nr:alpha/beta hydrolase [Microcella daejeonensis]WAB84355.1 alpha/beta fold hydrolase [Microcella daejeonensis]
MSDESGAALVAGGSVPAGALHVESEGPTDARTIVFLHGGSVSGWMWAPQRAGLQEFHHLVPDLPGYGGSREVPWRTIVETADRVADVIRDRAHLDEDGRARADVVGLSLGALVGAVLASRHPELVRSALLTGAPLRGLGPVMSWLSRVQLRLWSTAAYWRTRGRHYRVPSEAMAGFIESGIGIDPSSARRVVQQVNEGIEPMLPAVADAPVPLLGLAGARESRRIRSALGAIAEAPRSTVRLAPRMHHLWNLEDPALFTEVVRAWVAQGAVHARLEPVPRALLRPPRRGRSGRS